LGRLYPAPENKRKNFMKTSVRGVFCVGKGLIALDPTLGFTLGEPVFFDESV
jgi:hypothetical protein